MCVSVCVYVFHSTEFFLNFNLSTLFILYTKRKLHKGASKDTDPLWQYNKKQLQYLKISISIKITIQMQGTDIIEFIQ